MKNNGKTGKRIPNSKEREVYKSESDKKTAQIPMHLPI
jgi:hypothetical protein